MLDEGSTSRWELIDDGERISPPGHSAIFCPISETVLVIGAGQEVSDCGSKICAHTYDTKTGEVETIQFGPREDVHGVNNQAQFVKNLGLIGMTYHWDFGVQISRFDLKAPYVRGICKVVEYE